MSQGCDRKTRIVMKFRKLLITLTTALCIIAQTLAMPTVTVFADEAAEGVMNEEPPEGAEGEMPEGEMPEGEAADGEMPVSTGGVEVSSIQADNGKYIARSFPDGEVPAGFSTNTVDYQGEQISVAQMVTKSASIGTEGMTITLVYLTEADGSNGEFYLCDVTENAKMSDLIMINGAEGRYIIVLDPGDNITGPDGFIKRNLSWGSKSAVAWSLPTYSSDDEDEDSGKKDKKKDSDDEDDDEDKDSDAKLNLFSVNVYADELFTAGAGGGDDADAQEAAEKAMSDYIEESNIAHTNASGLIEAQPEDFCLLYAVDEEGNVGFYLYDIDQKIYQRYVDIPKGESDTLAKYRKQSRIRLIIIIVMAVALLVMLFILINTLTRGRDSHSSRSRYDDDDREDISDIRDRMERSRRGGGARRREEDYLMDRDSGFDDDMDEDEDEEEDEEEDYFDPEAYRRRPAAPQSRGPAPAPRRAPAPPSGRAPSRQAAPDRRGAAPDMDRGRGAAPDMDPRRRPAPSGAPTRGGQPQRPPRNGAPRRGNPRDDFDDDFEFEYLKFNK